MANFFAGDPDNRDGVRVAVNDLDGDDRADIVAGPGRPGVARCGRSPARSDRVRPPAVLLEVSPFPAPAGGVFVG